MSRRFLRSLSHAVRGIRTVAREEPNFRIQSACAAVILFFLFYFGFSLAEKAIVIFCMMMVLGAEMFNTLVENILDVIEPEHHASVGRMKDMMAGIVLVMSVFSVLVGALVVLNHFGR